MAAGATLYDVRQMFDACNVKADEALRSIVRQLPEAVSTCLEAAGAAVDPARQAALLKVLHMLHLLQIIIYSMWLPCYAAELRSAC